DVLVLVLMRFRVALARCAKAGRAKEVHLFVAVTWRREERAERVETLSHHADLFLTFTTCGGARIFTSLERAGGNFPRVASDRGPILPDESDLVRVVHRHDHDRAGVAHDLGV